MSGNLPLKYRPKYFTEVFGNEHAIQQVVSILNRPIKSMPKAWLFTGESGTGKTTMVRIIKEELGCSDTDFHEYNSSNTRGIDTIREISNQARMSPMDGKIKMFLFDECHQWTKDASNAILKLLEDGPSNTFFFLATTNPEKLLKAIKTRCTLISMKSLSSRQLSSLVRDISIAEGVEFSDKVYTAIGKSAGGSCREAIKILDQVIDIEDEDVALSSIEKSLGSESNVIELCQALINQPQWNNIRTILSNMDEDPETVRRIVLGYFNKVMLNSNNHIPAIIIEQFLNPFYESGKAGLTFACYTAVYLINNPD